MPINAGRFSMVKVSHVRSCARRAALCKAAQWENYAHPAIGALAGAGIGGLLGYYVPGRKKRSIRTALLGALGGGLAGGLGGSLYDSRAEANELSSYVDNLHRRLRDAGRNLGISENAINENGPLTAIEDYAFFHGHHK